MRQSDRLQQWIEQGNVTISQLFFQFYRRLKISDEEAIMLLQIHSFQQAGNVFPTPDEIAARMSANQNSVTTMLQKLMQQGYLSIRQETADGMLTETISLQPLWDKLVDCLELQAQTEKEHTQKEQEGEIFQLFEQEFGRFLSPMEIETISMWMDQDGHTPEVIRMALKEAVIAQKISLRYVDRILFEGRKEYPDVEPSVTACEFVPENIRIQPQESTAKSAIL
ncbi:DnaD domain protein [Planococcus sp. MB-3u-03]|uniref:DnaD domain protein n=1 Tax=Planococcus sp. MB-3u-03 TaxID=2058136 RepID=UPI001E32839E|nr:DnaD domain protein [Planococcus sp. MB-3u-03]